MYIVLIIIVLMLLLLGGMIVVYKRVVDTQVTQATRHLDEMEHGYEAKQKKINKDMEEARNKAREIVITAQNDAEKQKLEIIRQGQSESERIIQEARTKGDEMIRQAENSRHQMLSEIDERISRDALHKACQIIQEALPEELKRSAHVQWVRELIDNDFSEAARLHIPDDLQEVQVLSAFKLTGEQSQALCDKIKATVKRDIRVREDVDAALVAGVSITIGSLVLDGSLRTRIQERMRT